VPNLALSTNLARVASWATNGGLPKSLISEPRHHTPGADDAPHKKADTIRNQRSRNERRVAWRKANARTNYWRALFVAADHAKDLDLKEARSLRRPISRSTS
jgi:hypothetical protein